MTTPLDKFTAQHLAEWLEFSSGSEDTPTLRENILKFVAEYPETIYPAHGEEHQAKSWREIANLCGE